MQSKQKAEFNVCFPPGFPGVCSVALACQWASSQIVLKTVTQFLAQRCLRVLVVLEWESRTSPKIHMGIDGLVR